MRPRSAAPAGLRSEVERALAAPPRPQRRLWPALAAAAVLAAVAITIVQVRRPGGAWEVVPLAGAPRLDDEPIATASRLDAGEWLETDASSRARILFGPVGQVAVEPNTRVQLIAARRNEHRMALERGTIQARIWAPPRLFFVNTPSANAIDLGCAYTMHVEPDGRGLLRVTHGWVMLEDAGRESVVPAGAACRTYPRLGPGTPYFEDAGHDLIAALSRFDSGGRAGELKTVLAQARVRDTLTLWHLFQRVPPDARAGVLDRATALAPLPQGVTREALLRLDRASVDEWKQELEWYW
jgi:hypothetical protein